jgi:hypothetical protein
MPIVDLAARPVAAVSQDGPPGDAEPDMLKP